ncbi:MAG: FtsX-like permease family protein, partial [Dehalococcoidia bacterium]
IFGATFEPTLSKSQEDQALYTQGADISIISRIQANRQMEPFLKSLPDEMVVSLVRRESVRLGGGPAEGNVSVLAVTPHTLGQTTWFRSDFADKDLPELMSAIDDPLPPVAGVSIPEGAETLGVWISAEDPRGLRPQSLNIWARVVNSSGIYHNLGLGELPSRPGWHLMEGSVTGNGEGVQLVSFFVSGSILPASSLLNFDDVTVWGPGLPPDGMIIEGFEEPQPWTPIATRGQEADLTEQTGEAAHSGELGLRLTFGQLQRIELRGVFLTSGPYPVPVIGGPGFVTGQQFALRVNRSTLQVEVVDILRYFPTINPGATQFMIINLDHFAHFLSHAAVSQRVPPNEIWISTDPESDQSQFLETLADTLPPTLLLKERKEAVDSALRDPLAAGAWEGLTVLGITVMVGAILVSLVLLGTTSLRQARLDISVARALGFSNRQLAGSLVVERVLMVALAMLAGSLVGWWLRNWILSYLDITPTGGTIVPPLVLATDQPLLLLAYLSLISAALATIGFTLFLARRLKTAQVLRQTE